MSDHSPDEQVWDLLRGALATKALETVADLRVADALAGSRRNGATLRWCSMAPH